jgi:type IV pilus assembly protein PilY1
MDNAIASDLFTLDINANGITDRIYASGVGGRVIRVDIPDLELYNMTNSWDITGTVVADVGAGSDPEEFQRFFNSPEVAYYKRGGFTYLVILLASGHQPKPLDDTVLDRFYAIRDFAVWKAPADSGDADTDPDYADTIVEADLVDATNAPGAAASGKGWYIDLISPDGDRQKGYTDAVVYDYVVLFSTYTGTSTPSGDVCLPASSTGVSHIYAIDMRHGKSVLKVDGGYFRELENGDDPLDNSDRQIESNMRGLPPNPSLLFPDDDGKAGGKVLGVSGLGGGSGGRPIVEFNDRFHSISWEEVINE